MNQRRRLKGLIGLFLRHSLAGEPTQFLIDDGKEIARGLRIAGFDGVKNLSDVRQASELSHFGGTVSLPLDAQSGFDSRRLLLRLFSGDRPRRMQAVDSIQ